MIEGARRAQPQPGIFSPAAMAPIRRSAETMARAAAFLGAGSVGPPGASVLANSLRELDRFLMLLIDAVAETTLPMASDHRAFIRQNNTPNKLGRVHRALGVASPDQDRLRAIGRARERLFHAARAARGGTRLPGQRALSAELHAICLLYDRIGGELVAACEARQIH